MREAFALAAGAGAGLFLGTLLRVVERMVYHHHFSEPWKTPAPGPDAISTLDCHGQYRHLRLQRQPNRAGFESLQRTRLRCAPAFRKDHHHASITQELQRSSNRTRITALERQRPRSKPRQTSPNDGPTKSSAPREISCRSFYRKRKPERIDVRLMVGGNDHSAF